MLISDEPQIIVMLPQKCASKTIQIRLGHIRSSESLDSGVVYHDEVNKFISKHVSLKDAFAVSAFKNRADYPKVCFVRNPYDRVYSWFNWIRRSLEKPMPELEGEGCELARLKHIRSSRERKLEKMKAVGYDFNRYLNANVKFFKPANCFTHYRRKCYMDFIGYQEDFEADFKRMVKLFQLPVSSSEVGNVVSDERSSLRPEKMSGSDYQYAKFYNRESIRIINRRFKSDFKYYKYPVLKPRKFPRVVE